jgi:hypothetical protein
VEGTATRLICMSVEHRFDLVVERRVVEVLDLDGLEVLFGVEVSANGCLTLIRVFEGIGWLRSVSIFLLTEQT